MASFTLQPGAWVQIIAPGGANDQEIQIIQGRVLLSFGAPDPLNQSIIASSIENKLLVAPAGIEVQARATKASAVITTGDY